MNEFDHPLIAAVYDAFTDGRTDLDPYVALAQETGARSVLDIGCGTGALALAMSARGMAVVAVEPARAMLDRARRKPGAGDVIWVHGVIDDAPQMQADLATMTANTAQVFTTDGAWGELLAGIWARLPPGGLLAFNTRVPAGGRGTSGGARTPTRRGTCPASGWWSRGRNCSRSICRSSRSARTTSYRTAL